MLDMSTDELILFVPIALFSITIHEFAHGYVALLNGDDTAERMGRLTFNPLAHLDLFGALAFAFVGFGWAKPVPVNPLRYRDFKRGVILVSAAGPVSNLIVGVLAAIAIRLYFPYLDYGADGSLPTYQAMLKTALPWLMWLNFALFFFNLIPIFPLDGSHILRMLLTPRQEEVYAKYESHGALLLMFLFISGILGPIISFPIRILTSLLLGSF